MRHLVPLLPLCLPLVACHMGQGMDDIDDTVSYMIRATQSDALRQPDLDDPRTLPPSGMPFSGKADARAWDKRPATRNPAPEALEARTAQSAPPPADRLPIKSKLFDLNGLLAQAIETAPEYRTAKENLMVAALSLIIERHAWDPRLFAAISTNLNGVPEAGDHDTAANLIGEFGVTQKLPYGGEVSVSALSTFTSYLSQQAANDAFEDSQGTQLNLSASLPLLRGSGRVAQASLVQGERNLVYAARAFETFRRDLMVDMAGTYFNLLQSRQAIENQKKRMVSLEESRDRLLAQVKAGAAAPIDADNAALQASSAQAGVLAAEDAYRAQIDLLKVRLGLPLETPLDILDREVAIPIPELDVARAMNQARIARLDLQTARDQVDDAARDAEVARDQLRGDLTLTGQTGLPTRPDRRYGGGRLDAGSGSYAVGLKYSLPLDRLNESSALRRSLIGVEQARRGHALQADGIEARVRAAVRNIARAQGNLAREEQNILLAKRRLEQTKLRERDLGFRPVLDAENDLLAARNSHAQALTDLRLSILAYLGETGQIRVDPTGRWVPPARLAPAAPAPKGAPDGIPPAR